MPFMYLVISCHLKLSVHVDIKNSIMEDTFFSQSRVVIKVPSVLGKVAVVGSKSG